MVPLTEEGIMELVHASDMLFSKRVHRAIRSLQAEVAALRSRCEDLDSFMRAGNDQRVDMIRRAESAEAQVAALKVRLAEAERILDLEAKGEIVAMEARASAAEARVEVLRGVLTDIAITDPDAGNPSRFLVSLAKNALAEPKAEGAGE
jgi:chromosome condensin MukBEF ATPase and DNA-binding subunit MukB